MIILHYLLITKSVALARLSLLTFLEYKLPEQSKKSLLFCLALGWFCVDLLLVTFYLYGPFAFIDEFLKVAEVIITIFLSPFLKAFCNSLTVFLSLLLRTLAEVANLEIWTSAVLTHIFFLLANRVLHTLGIISTLVSVHTEESFRRSNCLPL